MKDITDRLRVTASILYIQAEAARRMAETYKPERDQYDARDNIDDRLVAMVRYQLDQEALCRNLTRDANEAIEAADRLDHLRVALSEIKEITKKQQLPITSQVYDIAKTALGEENDY